MEKSLSHKKALFLDFDGVIKDSVEVKSDAFEKLFLKFGTPIAKKIRLHHELNGGMSRFEKLPIYLVWAGLMSNDKTVANYSNKFSLIVKQNVIDSEWIAGVLEYLKDNYEKQLLFLVTATPEDEIKEITNKLKISQFFDEIIGSPTSKKEALKYLIKDYEFFPEESAMIGDSQTDYEAAKDNEVPFILRKTSLNIGLQSQLKCQMISNFINE